MNEHLAAVIVVPLTIKVKNHKGNPILISNKMNRLKTESEMLVFHVRSISKDRLAKKIESVQKEELSRTIKTLNDILKY